MEFTYRRATYDDLQGLRQVGLAAYGTFQPVLSEEGWNRLNKSLQDEDVYRELLGKSICIVCASDEKIIGMAFTFQVGMQRIFILRNGVTCAWWVYFLNSLEMV